MGWGRGVQEGNGGWIGSIYYINVWNFQRIKLVLKKKKAGTPSPGHLPYPSLQTSRFPCSVDKFKEMLYQEERRDSILQTGVRQS